jgi:hypothetical protein
MLDSIVVGSQLPPPGIGEHIEAPAGYIDYQDQKTGLGFSYPSEWKLEKPLSDDTIHHLAAPGETMCTAIITPFSKEMFAEQINWSLRKKIQSQFELGWQVEAISTVVPVSNATLAANGDSETVRLFVSATEPLEIPAHRTESHLFLLNQVSNENASALILGSVEDEECQEKIEMIMDTFELTSDKS